MNKMESLIELLDKDTRELVPSGKLLLIGKEDSVFLKAVKRKADALGVKCDLGKIISPPYKGIVVDREYPVNCPIPPEADIDHIITPGMSCVAQAILATLLGASLVSGKNITVVGRGHAVKGLIPELIKNNATVTVAHSKTLDLFDATMKRDVVIFATPVLYQYPAFDTKRMVIDLGNAIPEQYKGFYNCPYINRIGPLTVSVLLNRFARIVN